MKDVWMDIQTEEKKINKKKVIITVICHLLKFKYKSYTTRKLVVVTDNKIGIKSDQMTT